MKAKTKKVLKKIAKKIKNICKDSNNFEIKDNTTIEYLHGEINLNEKDSK